MPELNTTDRWVQSLSAGSGAQNSCAKFEALTDATT